jgi:hypothetical protein
MTWQRRVQPFASTLILVVVLAVPARAERPLVGVRGGIYTDADAGFLGGEFLTRVAPALYFDPNAEFVFVEDGSYITLNADLHYDLPHRGRAFAWVGGGLAVILRDPGGNRDSDTDLGANLLLGVGFRSRRPIPYLQLKLIASGHTEAVLAFGVRF